MPRKVRVIGAGLAGCEAAFQAAKRCVEVERVEQKPASMSPAHSYAGLAELVCSNSLGSDRALNAAGLLKQEMRLVGSLIIEAADATSVPAGSALAVDRYAFSDYITRTIRANPRIRLVQKEAEFAKEDGKITIVATGPLTSEKLLANLRGVVGGKYLYFFDAAAPIVIGDSIDERKVFWGSRYGQGSDYINSPITKEEYDVFYDALIHAECAEQKDFEDDGVFEGCMPVEMMAKRGYRTLLFGPCKPIGFFKEKAKMPYAVVQLRKEDTEGRLLNIVGFQTHLKFPEQKRVFSLIPGLKNAEFVRMGVMHKNTYIHSPGLLDQSYRLRSDTDVYFAGQITGVEGYVESAASGMVAGICAAYQAFGKEAPVPSAKTALGALAAYVSGSVSANFQPMNIAFGIIEEPPKPEKDKKKRREQVVTAALAEIRRFTGELSQSCLESEK